MATGPTHKHGEICWHDCHTPDGDGARKFYSELFGWETAEQDMGPFKYIKFSQGGKDLGGIIPMAGPEWQGVPPHWMLYVHVDDVDAAAAKVAQLGGTVCVPPTDIGVARFAVVSDPAGATFSLIKMAASA